MKEDEDSKKIREQYVAHVSRMLNYIGETDTEAKAKRILELETQLAEPRLDKVARRDFRNYNNRYHVNDLNTVAENINWKNFMSDLGMETLPDTVLVMEPKYMSQLDQMMVSTPIEDLKLLTKWATFNDATGQLSTEIEKEASADIIF